MDANAEARRLRIYLSSTDKFKSGLLYETLVFAARRYGLTGATVLKGVMGFGSSSVVRSTRFWEITEKLPVVIEIVDEAGKIERFTEKILPWFDKIDTGCLITSEKADIILFKQGKKKKGFLRL
jgi:PII-like signaling protein